ncbi:U11/U12 small nuclear ribonucleoprotein 25 kDa protein-like [Anneissia japonica]|uniref:U11/U12 small nuclear ribonucleoprotein 25 kDa protein-like n=1 Tax=Anneissia japonica TaxID=1529436 RepID=UPI0014259719|nr:U11/U12 small nuclear ribonucleoprotein 25 kDa protein-like [Anneissia japonica]
MDVDSSPRQIMSMEDSLKENTEKDRMEEEDPFSKEMPHQDAMKVIKEGIEEAIGDDPLLCDLPTDVTPEEVSLQVALEYGQAMLVNVCREDGEVMPIVVLQGASVLDLKKAIARYISLKFNREGITKSVSWRFVWRRYWLSFGGHNLTQDNKLIKDYGIKNKDPVTFVKRLKGKGAGY